MTTPVQTALTALLPLKAAAVEGLRAQLKQPLSGPSALASTGIVHFSRIFVFGEDNPAGIPSNIAAVITSYDGDFATYIQAFVDNEGSSAFFNALLGAVDDPAAAGLIPVKKNAQAFAALVAKYDVTNPALEPWGQWFSAYPGKTVKNIEGE